MQALTNPTYYLYTSACLVYDALIEIFAVLGGTSQEGQAEGAPL